jgi:hypothetical protein
MFTGYHTPEARKAISDAMRLAHKEGRHRWSTERKTLPYADLPHQQRVRRRLLDALGGKCITCGFSDWRALQIDHTNGDGRSDPHRYGSRNNYAKVVLANPSKYQVLCANCNWIKRYENGEHRRDLED